MLNNEQLSIWPETRTFSGCGYNRVQDQKYRTYTLTHAGESEWTPAMQEALDQYNAERAEKSEKARAEFKRKEDLLCQNGLTVSTVEEEFETLIGDADISVGQEDQGIGHYEYWGATGFDSCMVASAEGGNDEDELKWVQRDFPSLEGDELSATHSGFIVTKVQYCSKTDENYEDGHSVTFNISGRITAFAFTQEILTVEHEGGHKECIPYYSCEATVAWEVGDES